MNKDAELAINNAYECCKFFPDVYEKRAHVMGCLSALFITKQIDYDDYNALCDNVFIDFPLH